MEGWKCIPGWGRVRLIRPHVWKDSTNVLVFCPEDNMGLVLELPDDHGLYSASRLIQAEKFVCVCVCRHVLGIALRYTGGDVAVECNVEKVFLCVQFNNRDKIHF